MLTHRDSHCWPSLLSPASANFQKQVENQLFLKKKKRKKKAQENGSKSCPLSGTASGLRVHFPSVQTHHPSARIVPGHVRPQPATRAGIGILA